MQMHGGISEIPQGALHLQVKLYGPKYQANLASDFLVTIFDITNLNEL